jgi:ABC-type sugar transport system ATPase subunit
MTTLDSAEAPSTIATRANESLVRVSGLAKSFGATQALRACTYELNAGEVHALVGENGSGKSTCAKILSGVHAPDAGEVWLFDTPTSAPRTPRAAQDLGIVTVFQEILVSEALSVVDNVWMGADTVLRAGVPMREKRARASEALDELLGRTLDLDTPVEQLSLSERQTCCIARALVRRPQVLILDEATSALDVATRDRLFEIIRRLTKDGAGVVLITHRMDELTEIADRTTVLRSGETVGTLEGHAWTPRELVRLMAGSDRVTEDARERVEKVARRGGCVLSLRNLQLAPERRPFDAAIHAGELIGVAGLEGHGQDEFLEALRGNGGGDELVRHVDGRELVIRSPKHAASQGIAYLPRERGQAIFRWMSIRENFGMPTLRRDSRAGWLRPGATVERLAAYTEKLGIVLRSPEDAITTLSGGNQQKVLLSRWLAADPKILVLNDPTRGVDIGTKRDLYVLLAALARDGLAVVMLSTELDEHVELMDRVLVFREHELVQEIGRTTLSRESLVSAFFGQSEEAST